LVLIRPHSSGLLLIQEREGGAGWPPQSQESLTNTSACLGIYIYGIHIWLLTLQLAADPSWLLTLIVGGPLLLHTDARSATCLPPPVLGLGVAQAKQYGQPFRPPSYLASPIIGVVGHQAGPAGRQLTYPAPRLAPPPLTSPILGVVGEPNWSGWKVLPNPPPLRLARRPHVGKRG
jgi:hypothetical protein